MAGIDHLVEDLERSYREAQERLSDPAVYNDHREAAEVGRRLKELEGPVQARPAVARGARRPRGGAERRRAPKGSSPEYEQQARRLEEELKLALVEADPADRKDVIVEIRQGVGGDEAALWAGDVYRMLTRYAERRGFKVEELLRARATAAASRRSSSRSRATARTRSSSGRAGRTASSASPRPSRRGASTPRRRPSP